ncbi:MAG: energy-coupling factor ABC transporter permease [Limisphaerales bacterium]
MHIPDGFLDGRTCAGTFCVAAAGLRWAASRVQAVLGERTVPLLGVMSAFLFAGQTVNFPVAGGTSGHLLGAALAVTFLGPYAAAVALTTVLVVQSLLFQDGGVTALGANVLNMALVAPFGAYAVQRALRPWFPHGHGIVFRAGVAAWVSVELAATACALELGAAGTIKLNLVLPAMTLVHAGIGLGEAIITGAVVSFVLKVRPDLVYETTNATVSSRSLKSLLKYGLLLTAGVALLLAPLASSLPDGLQSLAARFGFLDRARHWLAAPLADYEVPGISARWLGASLAAAVGASFAFGLACLLMRWLRRPRPNVNEE